MLLSTTTTITTKKSTANDELSAAPEKPSTKPKPACPLCVKLDALRKYVVKHGDSDETTAKVLNLLDHAFLSKVKEVRSQEIPAYLTLMVVAIPLEFSNSESIGDDFYDTYLGYKGEFKAAMSKYTKAQQMLFSKTLKNIEFVNKHGNG